MSRSIQLLVIDPQNDFCDLPAHWHGHDPLADAAIAPSLPVAGAHADLQRLAGWLSREGSRLDEVTITLDSHQRYDVAHPGFWRADGGGEIVPFTPITAAQVRSGEFAPRDAAALPRVMAYLDALEALGRYTLVVWPVHCEVGSWGHGVHAGLLAACAAWQAERGRAVCNVFKGMNPWTEHYSAIQAEVPDAADPHTALNTRLLDAVGKADLLIVAGEAGSHCVRATTEHLLQYLPQTHPRWQPRQLLLLTDCMSPVPGFEMQQEDFLAAMRAQGVQLATTADIHLND
jgi:nicotinamidase-related amidase